ncbi:restriction endonuclease subunit S [Vibrio parahaemolyticus]|uniref:restriction endonuclease subunit S n=1 Tax=Vibrio parahaemolyticus TaxID=670 RepID=UPI0012ACFBD6|nr:restriction endonuclease subunit S [Vibrio parahaemolyticus]EJC6779074.1 restriction endonuclease subunit S [Vibrio parahaemolyticus]EKN4569234.1 restriction endonuclease subunit S [Vibrio parahaemolyticus]ELA7625709.1 restriction endonuclease subunit S [Vibrio parahaemolyticus]ELA7627089.1 restriction endonuclease subunit S [Vibrio parahaemolyticus]HAS6534621.1 hypothetical protein [Vibrio parahaemolyticus]
MGKYQTYSEYRSWNNKWISCLPASWQLVPLKYICSGFVKDGPHETPKFTDDGIPFLSVDGIQDNKLVFNGCRYISEEDHVRYSMKCHPKQGDVLLGKAASVGKVAYVDSNMDFNVWSPLAVITAKSNKYGKYIYYCLQSSMLQAQCEVFANSNTQKNLGMNTIDNLDMPLPSEHEADVITNFLDHETAKIDTLIEKQQQLIKLLKEKRQAVISHAVTKGLNPQAPMKNSGVEWLGEVPEHWDVVPLKYLVDEKAAGPYGASLTKSMYTTSGIKVYGQQQVISNDFTVGDYFISDEKYKEMTRYTVFPDDVLISVMGTVGKVAVVPKSAEFGIINPRLVRYKFSSKKVLPRFVQALIMSLRYQNRLSEASQGSTMEGLNMGILGDLPLTFPSLEEQAQLLDFIDEKVTKYSSAINKAQEFVKLSSERRTALISAAVTGKIDVQNWQAPTPQMQALEQTA